MSNPRLHPTADGSPSSERGPGLPRAAHPCYVERVSGSTPYDALLQAAERDAEAAEGLASAYARLAPAERRALLATVVEDSAAAGRSPVAVLTLLLSVEPEPSLVRAIAERLMQEGVCLHHAPAGAWTWGGDDDGGVALVRWAQHRCHEVVLVSWRAGALEWTRVNRLAHDEPAADAASRAGVPEGAEPVAWDAALDRLAARLWELRRRQGALPKRLRPLAGLFVP